MRSFPELVCVHIFEDGAQISASGGLLQRKILISQNELPNTLSSLLSLYKLPEERLAAQFDYALRNQCGNKSSLWRCQSTSGRILFRGNAPTVEPIVLEPAILLLLMKVCSSGVGMSRDEALISSRTARLANG